MNILKYICLPGLLASGDIQTVSAVESKTDKNPNRLMMRVIMTSDLWDQKRCKLLILML